MDEDNSQLFARPKICLDCGETFTLGEMIPGKIYGEGLQCPYCRSSKTARNGPPLS